LRRRRAARAWAVRSRDAAIDARAPRRLSLVKLDTLARDARGTALYARSAFARAPRTTTIRWAARSTWSASVVAARRAARRCTSDGGGC
jgi:hypothetical protein